MAEELKSKIEVIHGNLFNLVDHLNLVTCFVDSIGGPSDGFETNGHNVDLKIIFTDIRDKIMTVSEQIEDNLKGLKMIALE